MKEKIMVEINRKECEIELASPTYGEAQELRKVVTERITELSALQKKAATAPDTLSKEDIQKILSLLEIKDTKMNELILACCTNQAITKIEDFQNMSADGVIKLHEWVEQKTGMSKEVKNSGFMKT